MAECEICGVEEPLYLVEIDRAKLRVCRDCSKSGKVLVSPGYPRPQRKEKPIQKKTRTTEIEIVSDYGKRIKDARNGMKIKREVLAEMINEKASFLDRVESERTLPPEQLAKKLEKALNITLFEEVGTEQNPVTSSQSRGVTLGDIIKVKKRGNMDGY